MKAVFPFTALQLQGKGNLSHKHVPWVLPAESQGAGTQEVAGVRGTEAGWCAKSQGLPFPSWSLQ